MRIVGLTGGIATGKSTTSRSFSDLGVPIIDADVIARKVMERPRVKSQVLRSFPESIRTEDGKDIDRKKLGSLIFSDEKYRKILNAIMHPVIQLEMARQVLWLLLTLNQVVILDVPLLFESRLHLLCHESILVSCSTETQLERLMRRDGISKEEALNKMNAQMKLEEKKKLADVVIDNDQSLGDLKEQVKRIKAKHLSPSRLITILEFFVYGPTSFLAWIVLNLYILIAY